MWNLSLVSNLYMNSPSQGILVPSVICNLSAKNGNESLFWWQCTWLFRDWKTCFVYSYIILAKGVNMSFFPWPHAVLIIPDEYFHKCKSLSRSGLKQNVRTTSCWPFSSPDGMKIWVKRHRFLPYWSQGRSGKSVNLRTYLIRVNYHSETWAL